MARSPVALPGPDEQVSVNGHAAVATDDQIVRLERERDRLRGVARETLGIVGDSDAPPLRQAIARSGVGWYPLLALGGLVIVDEFQTVVLAVLGPEISRSLGLSPSALAGLIALKTVASMLAAVPIAAYVQKRAHRGLVSIVTGLFWAVMTGFTAFVTNAWGLFVALFFDGASTGSVRSVHYPLMVDTYPPATRARALSFYTGANAFGQMLGPALVAVLTGLLGVTWRGAFIGMFVVCLAVALFAVRLRDPGYGRWDTDQVRGKVRAKADSAVVDLEPAEARLGFWETLRRLLIIPTIRRTMVASAIMGMFFVPLLTFIFFFLDEKWGMGPAQRGVLFAIIPALQFAVLAYFGPRAERRFRENPARVLDLGAAMVVVVAVSFGLVVLSPWFVPMVLMLAVGSAAFYTVTPLTALVGLAIVPPRMRPVLSAASGMAFAAIGGLGGLILLSGIESRFGVTGAIFSLSVPGLIAAGVIRSARKTVNPDLDRMIDEIIESEEVAALAASGKHLPMLACRRVDFSYGQLQVLFGVDFTVDDGEMVALLGTNGAGKSTLLRVISGLGLPSSGTVRYRGVDITHLGAERRLGLGIVQIPGGRSVFGPLSVVENLRSMAYTFGRDRKAIDAGLEASFEAFPRLAERRNQPAATLSGGEQQMLGLCTAFILKPRLLLIDELSLGLAPKIVTELLAMVRRINDAGTAIVLVEQSVNIALSVVEHAYFMEKGQIRFDGRARDLLARPDLLRSVFLEGAGA